MAEKQIIVFAKAPRHGRVKTRMYPALTSTESVRLHKQLLQHTLLTCVTPAKTRVQLCCSPDKQARVFHRIEQRLGVSLSVQQGRGLGQRMRQALNASQPAGHQPVVLLGADCPAITAGHLQQAFSALENSDVVFGPATDGGYVLIGARIMLPARCFDGIAWGGDKVLEQSLDKMEAAGISYSLLPPLQDIDRPEDLASLDQARLHRMRWLFGIE